MIGVEVGVPGPGVGVAGVDPNRTIAGFDHKARSPVADPVASTVKMNLTSCPANELRSTLVRKNKPSYFSRHVHSVLIGPLPIS